MMSVLSKIGDLIKAGAPTLGGLVFGSAGEKGIELAMGLVSSALGVENEPDAIEAALKNDPEALVKIKTAEIENKTILEKAQLEHDVEVAREETKRIQEAAETQRKELSSEDGFVRRARPFFMNIFAISLLVQMIAVSYVIAFKPADEAATTIASVVQLAGMWTIALGIVGVYIKMRSDDKNPNKGIGLLGALAEKIKG